MRSPDLVILIVQLTITGIVAFHLTRITRDYIRIGRRERERERRRHASCDDDAA